jgi:hypothetical protein
VTDAGANPTADDVADPGWARVARTALLARQTGVLLIGLAAVGAVAWLWIAVSEQGLFNSGGRFPIEISQSMSLSQRVDLFASSVAVLMSATLVGGLGLGLRLASDYLLALNAGAPVGAQPERGVGGGAVVEAVDSFRGDESATDDGGNDAEWAP